MKKDQKVVSETFEKSKEEKTLMAVIPHKTQKEPKSKNKKQYQIKNNIS